MEYFVYIAISDDKKDFYVGITVDMHRRINALCAQSDKNCKIVFYEEYDDSNDVNRRYKELQSFPKSLITELVSENNPLWVDVLYP